MNNEPNSSPFKLDDLTPADQFDAEMYAELAQERYLDTVRATAHPQEQVKTLFSLLATIMRAPGRYFRGVPPERLPEAIVVFAKKMRGIISPAYNGTIFVHGQNRYVREVFDNLLLSIGMFFERPRKQYPSVDEMRQDLFYATGFAELTSVSAMIVPDEKNSLIMSGVDFSKSAFSQPPKTAVARPQGGLGRLPSAPLPTTRVRPPTQPLLSAQVAQRVRHASGEWDEVVALEEVRKRFDENSNPFEINPEHVDMSHHLDKLRSQGLIMDIDIDELYLDASHPLAVFRKVLQQQLDAIFASQQEVEAMLHRTAISIPSRVAHGMKEGSKSKPLDTFNILLAAETTRMKCVAFSHVLAGLQKLVTELKIPGHQLEAKVMALQVDTEWYLDGVSAVAEKNVMTPNDEEEVRSVSLAIEGKGSDTSLTQKLAILVGEIEDGLKAKVEELKKQQTSGAHSIERMIDESVREHEQIDGVSANSFESPRLGSGPINLISGEHQMPVLSQQQSVPPTAGPATLDTVSGRGLDAQSPWRVLARRPARAVRKPDVEFNVVPQFSVPGFGDVCRTIGSSITHGVQSAFRNLKVQRPELPTRANWKVAGIFMLGSFLMHEGLQQLQRYNTQATPNRAPVAALTGSRVNALPSAHISYAPTAAAPAQLPSVAIAQPASAAQPEPATQPVDTDLPVRTGWRARLVELGSSLMDKTTQLPRLMRDRGMSGARAFMGANHGPLVDNGKLLASTLVKPESGVKVELQKGEGFTQATVRTVSEYIKGQLLKTERGKNASASELDASVADVMKEIRGRNALALFADGLSSDHDVNRKLYESFDKNPDGSLKLTGNVNLAKSSSGYVLDMSDAKVKTRIVNLTQTIEKNLETKMGMNKSPSKMGKLGNFFKSFAKKFA